MTRIAVLASPESWYYRDLARAAGSDYRLTPVTFRALHGYVGLPDAVVSADIPLTREHFDAVLVRTMPAGSLEQIVFRMNALAALERSGQTVVNPPRAIEAAVDKYLCTERLAAAGLPVPLTWCGQTTAEALTAFDRLGGDVVLKPLFGSEGRGITRLTDRDLAERAFALLQSLGGAIYLQQYIDHGGHDLRLLVIGDEVLGMRRANAHDWRTNVQRGAEAHFYEVSATDRTLALEAARAVGALVAGVDVLKGPENRPFLIEVNAVPGWRALGRIQNLDIARKMLDFTASLARSRS